MAKKRKKQKSPMLKYTIQDFHRQFPNEGSCLEWLRDYRWPNGIHCKNCSEITSHYLSRTRKSFCCQNCGNHVHPTVGTIAHKSRTPLVLWFYVVYLMAQTRGGISAKQIERETGVTYKTAWRICNKIRERLEEDKPLLDGDVEIDESYFGGKKKGGKRGRGSENKTPVVGIAQRKGKVEAQTVPNVQGKTILPMVADNVEKGSNIYTDEFKVYNALPAMGYHHETVPHAKKIYVLGNAHTNTLEGFWSNCKNGIRGVYHSVSSKYLQDYVNEYLFRLNHRNDVTPMFLTFLRRMFDPRYLLEA